MDRSGRYTGHPGQSRAVEWITWQGISRVAASIPKSSMPTPSKSAVPDHGRKPDRLRSLHTEAIELTTVPARAEPRL
ncbi:hypothetical protein HPB47_008560 [Ixodes persulcatus]|uniref:Uncharacterized protein n=1 Tax=Ixodes persulcatus TaxID=34615 RepID=A0AC60P4E6_IXOPE|nr:hypothetical protein HPB47_008560 [Ixodes persulcatus]